MARTNWVDSDAVNGKVDAAAMNALGREVNAVKRRRFHVDEYGADPTGVADSNQALIDAYTAMGTSPGEIVFGVGTYKLYVGLNQAAARLVRPRQAVVGQGAGLTTIDYRGAGAFVETRNLDFDTDSAAPAGGVHAMTISGWNNGEDDACGVRYGDLWRMRITDVEIVGFTQAEGKGLWGDNQTHWSERGHIECVANQCTENFVFESNTGASDSGSFDYSQFWLSFIAQPGQHGFVLRSGASGSVVSMNGVSLTLTGNCQIAASGPNTGEMFRVGKDNDDQASLSGELQIGVETSGDPSGTPHYDLMVGDGPWWDAKAKVTAVGAINLIPFSGADFQLGSARPSNFAFAGLLKGSPSLGSTSTVQAFQTLQLLSQARGRHYLSSTDEVQTIYVTKATGGTYPLTFDGSTTASPLPHNATAAQMQTALRALASVGGANVWVSQGQARFVDGVQQDERAYIVEFGGPLSGTDLPLITADDSGLTGTGHAITVETKIPGSAHDTFITYLEGGNIFLLEPDPGTYRVRFDIGGLTMMTGAGDSPFGVTTVDIWIKQPDTGGPAVFEAPWFAPAPYAGSTARFEWMDGVDPVLSTEPGVFDIIRLTSYNFSTWIGQHITRPDASVAVAWASITGKPSTFTPATHGHSAGDITGLTKSSVGLSNVDNTADSAKSVATAAALTTARTIDGQSFDGSANITVIAPGTHAATSKTTPADADELPLVDSAASNVLKKLTWANLVAALKTYFDSVATTLTNKTLTTPVINGLPTGTGVASVPTGSTLVARDANGVIQVFNTLASGSLITASGGTTDLDSYNSREVQQVNGSTTHAIRVKNSFNLGNHITIVNNTAASTVTVKANDGSTLPGGTLAAQTIGEWFAIVNGPADSTGWMKR